MAVFEVDGCWAMLMLALGQIYLVQFEGRESLIGQEFLQVLEGILIG